MAFLLYRYVRRKINDHQAKKVGSVIEDSNLIPEVTTSQYRDEMQHITQHESGIGGPQTPADKRTVFLGAEEAAREKEETRKRNIRQWKLMLGLALPNFLASVDVTIVAPAIPLISSHFSMSTITNEQLLHILIHSSQIISLAVSTGSLPPIL
jgi:hypothetical protein